MTSLVKQLLALNEISNINFQLREVLTKFLCELDTKSVGEIPCLSKNAF